MIAVGMRDETEFNPSRLKIEGLLDALPGNAALYKYLAAFIFQ
jgi:hypothetical protein